MPVTPSSILSLPLYNAKVMVSNSANFQAWTGAADETEALDFIHYGREPAGATFPYLVIGFGGGYGRMDDEGAWVYSGTSLEWLFFDEITDGTTPDDAYLGLLNNVGLTMENVEAMADQAPYLEIESWDISRIKIVRKGDDGYDTNIGERAQMALDVRHRGI